MSNSDENEAMKRPVVHGKSLLDHLESTYTPADAYFACILALATLTVAMDIPLRVTLEGVEAAHSDLKAKDGGGDHGTH